MRDYSNGADYAFMDTVEDKTSNKQWLITLHLGNSNVQFRIDTGADETVFPVEVYKELQDVNPLKVPDKKLFGVGEKSMLTVVSMFTSVLWGKTRTSTLSKLHDNPAIEALQLNRRVESVEDKTDYQNEFSDLFEGPGKMEGFYTITLKEDAQPVAITVPRRLPLPLMAKTKKELKKMEEMEMIMRIEQPTNWCTPMVVVPKKDDVKICIDLTKINKSVLREMPSVEYTLEQLTGAKSPTWNAETLMSAGSHEKGGSGMSMIIRYIGETMRYATRWGEGERRRNKQCVS